MTIDTPCNGICRMNQATALCEGCARTIEEIIAWGSMNEDERRKMMERLEGRRR